MTSQPAAGFTWLELLTVLAIMGVLSSLALPSFQQSQRRSQRTMAKAALLQSAHWMERSVNGSGAYPAALPDALWRRPELQYSLSVVSDGSRFELQATPLKTQAGDACGSLTLRSNGERGVQNATLSAAQCWGN
ncbi:MAG: type IV pilin protein [Betaproteobacteria bacterium]|nr:type IV pilin protein [Betaproteobacteria bacterium]